MCIWLYLCRSIYISTYDMYECACVYCARLSRSLLLLISPLKHAFSLSLYQSRVHPFIFRMHSLISYALLPQYACWFDCSVLKHFAVRSTSPLLGVCEGNLSLFFSRSLSLPFTHWFSHSQLFLFPSLPACRLFSSTHTTSDSLFLSQSLMISHSVYTSFGFHLCVLNYFCFAHFRTGTGTRWNEGMFCTTTQFFLISLLLSIFLLLFLLDFRKNTEGNKILFANF